MSFDAATAIKYGFSAYSTYRKASLLKASDKDSREIASESDTVGSTFTFSGKVFREAAEATTPTFALGMDCQIRFSLRIS